MICVYSINFNRIGYNTMLTIKSNLFRLSDSDQIYFRLKQLELHYGTYNFTDIFSNWNDDLPDFKQIQTHKTNLFNTYGKIEVLQVYADKYMKRVA